MKTDDQKLLLDIFDVSQCDRTEEGDAFTPPDPNLEYIVKVRSLVGEEWVVPVVLAVKICVRQVSVIGICEPDLLQERGMRDRRRVRFADKNFVMATWTVRINLTAENRASNGERPRQIPGTSSQDLGLPAFRWRTRGPVPSCVCPRVRSDVYAGMSQRRHGANVSRRISYTAPTKFGLVKLDVDENFKHSLLEDELG